MPQFFTKLLLILHLGKARRKYRCSQTTFYKDHAKDELLLRRKGIEHQDILRELRDLKQRKNDGKTRLDNWDDGRLFIECAKEILPAARFKEIWDLVLVKRKF